MARTQIQTPLSYRHTPSIPQRNTSLQRHRDKARLDHIATLSRSRSRSRQGIREDSSRCGSYVSTCTTKKNLEAPLALRLDRDMGAGSPASTQSREAESSHDGTKFSSLRGQRSSSGESDISTLWKRRSLVGAETLRGLFPSMAYLSTPARNGEINRGTMQEDDKERRTAISARGKGRKETSKWGWATWF